MPTLTTIPNSVFDLAPSPERLLYWVFILVVGLAIAYLSNKLTQVTLGDDSDEPDEESSPTEEEPEP